jgi:hypothetical protein
MNLEPVVNSDNGTIAKFAPKQLKVSGSPVPVVTLTGSQARTFKSCLVQVHSFQKINDLQFEVIETFQNEDGSRVASRWPIAGKNNAILGTLPDQQPISFTGTAVWAVREDGKLCHNWVERSSFELFQQLRPSASTRL